MTAILGSRADKEASINMLEHILSAFVMNGLTHAQKQGIIEHMAWMHRQKPDLNVNCKLETVPELQMTRVVLEYSFLPIPSLKTN